MATFKNALIILNLVCVVLLGSYLLYSNGQHKSGYIINQEVFNKFKGKEELELQLNKVKESHKMHADSLLSLMRATSNPDQLRTLEQQLNSLQEIELELSDKYSSDIWKRINSTVIDFGKEKGYDFIFGASGNGALMYAENTYNVTEEVIKYLNEKYEGEH